MPLSGSLNTPTFVRGAVYLSFYGNVTFIPGMTVTPDVAAGFLFKDSGALTSAGRTLGALYFNTAGVTTTLVDALNIGTSTIHILSTAILATGNNNVTCGIFIVDSGTPTLTPGSSTISCTAWVANGMILTANTATINISGTGACALGSANWNGCSFNLTGTAHTVSGSPTGIDEFNLAPVGTTQVVTFTSGDDVSCVDFSSTGASRALQILIQSSTLGTPATITASNSITVTNTDFMDIEGAGVASWDLSAVDSVSDAQGNTGITFSAAIDQTSASTDAWSVGAGWTSGIVPRCHDDVTCSHSKTIDIARIGKSITFVGAITVTRSVPYSFYGSYYITDTVTMVGGYIEVSARGRGNYSINNNNVSSLPLILIRAFSGTYEISNMVNDLRIHNGTVKILTNIALPRIELSGTMIKRLEAIGVIITLTTRNDMTSQWAINPTNTTMDLTGSTIIYVHDSNIAHTFAGGSQTYNNVQVAGAGNYALTVTGDNHIANLEVDASLAPKTIVNTGAIQTVDDFTRDTGTNVITLTNGTWNATGTDPIWLDYLTVSGSTATPDVWFAGSHSTDGGGNTGWRFDDPAISVATISATGITMDKDGVTGGTLTGNVTTILRGTPRIPVHAEIGLTAAYGANVTGGTIYDNGLFTISVPVNQTPGATYHYRMVGETGNGTSPFEGADGTYTYTMPTVTTVGATPYSVATSGATSSTLTGSLDTMGVASSAYVLFNYWGYTSSDNTTISTLLAPATVSLGSTGYDYSEPGYYRVVAKIGDVYVYGSTLEIAEIENSGIGAALIAYMLIMGFVAGIAALSKDKKGNM